ncbi:MAG: hypothetical protein GKR97_19675 [Rhizobiaceae bacterium]|nr:hypothetical protein [Rhizobiaceae bacterium]
MNDATKEAQNLFEKYLDCWNNRDLEGVASCFDEPSVFVLPSGAVPLPNRQALVSLLQNLFAGLEKAGFSHTTIGSIEAKLCGEDLAILDAANVDRIKHDGSLLERIDGHYVMRNCDGQWRLVVAVACTSGWQKA